MHGTWLRLDLILAAHAQGSVQLNVLSVILVRSHLHFCGAGVHFIFSLQLKIPRLRKGHNLHSQEAELGFSPGFLGMHTPHSPLLQGYPGMPRVCVHRGPRRCAFYASDRCLLRASTCQTLFSG